MAKLDCDWIKNTEPKDRFWREDYLINIMRSIEYRYRRGLLRVWVISDISIVGDMTAVKWTKLSVPLTDEEVRKMYGY